MFLLRLDGIVSIATQIADFADENEVEILLADGFEQALIGLGRQFNKYLAVYSREECIKVLMYRDGMSREDANEFFDFNVVGAYVGENTPVFIEDLG